MTNPFAAPGSEPAPPPPPPGGWGPPPYAGVPLPPYGWAPPAEPPTKTNAWAIVALVTGIVALFPIAITAGIVGLVQIKRRNERGTGLAIAGLVLGGLWLAFFGLATLGYFLDASSSSGDAVLGRIADAGSQSQRTCLLKSPKGLRPASPVDCAQAHDGEVFLVNSLPDRPWPGYEQTENDADDLCYSGFEDYVGSSYDNSDYDYAYFRPDRGEWLAGERRVVCLIVASDGGKLHGSAYNSQR